MRKGYDAIGFYHDAEDPRLWVPKRIAAMGWTINLDHRGGPLTLALIGVAVIGAAAATVAAAI